MDEKLKQFTLPLTQDEIVWKIQSFTKGTSPKTIVVPYIDNRAVMNRLDNCFGAENWSSSFTELKDGIKCTLTINGVSKEDGADVTSIEPTKGGISDAMKRAATQWGLGRELYDYPRVFVKGQQKFLSDPVKKALKNIDTSAPVVVIGEDGSINGQAFN